MLLVFLTYKKGRSRDKKKYRIRVLRMQNSRAALKSVGALGPDLIWAPLNTPKKFCHVYSTQHPVSMNFYGHGRKVSL